MGCGGDRQTDRQTGQIFKNCMFDDTTDYVFFNFISPEIEQKQFFSFISPEIEQKQVGTFAYCSHVVPHKVQVPDHRKTGLSRISSRLMHSLGCKRNTDANAFVSLCTKH